MTTQSQSSTNAPSSLDRGLRPEEDWRFTALGLPPTADKVAVERAYWALTRDRGTRQPLDRDAARRLAQIDAAYQALLNPETDLWARWQAAGQRQPQPASGWSLADSVITAALTLCLLFNVVLALSTAGNPAAQRVTGAAQMALHRLEPAGQNVMVHSGANQLLSGTVNQK